MAPSNSSPGNSDDPLLSSPTAGEEQQQNTNQTTTNRSYECIFCKRGFTNAQALGGHMNIHRKHKAKLKQSHAGVTVTGDSFPISCPQGKSKPLPLFGDGSSDSRNIHRENVKKDPPSPEMEIDLELRLGQVESPANKSNTTTRKFF